MHRPGGAVLPNMYMPRSRLMTADNRYTPLSGVFVLLLLLLLLLPSSESVYEALTDHWQAGRADGVRVLNTRLSLG